MNVLTPPYLITIDGPAGAGKTTVSRMLASRLQYRYVDTGALYRAVAYEAKLNGIGVEDDEGLDTLCRRLNLQFSGHGDDYRLLSGNTDITDYIRSPEISMMASAVSARKVVRDHLLTLQRQMGEKKGVVFEGRDMGTVVFPHADVKFFLTASLETRARRRYLEIQASSGLSLEQIMEQVQRRDTNDSTRNIAPLAPAADAITIDSTHLSIPEVVDQMVSHIRSISQ